MGVGDEDFFGYIVAVGLFPDPSWDWKDQDHFVYADFYYNGEYTRYRLPQDDNLVSQLKKRVFDNIRELHDTDYSCFSTKIWIERLPNGGWNTFLP